MTQPEFEELLHNETYVCDVMQDNEEFLASFMSKHDRGDGSSSDIVATPCQRLTGGKVVQIVEDRTKGNT